jgi:hypothetical protein
MSGELLGIVRCEEKVTNSRDPEQPERDDGGAALTNRTRPRIDLST